MTDQQHSLPLGGERREQLEHRHLVSDVQKSGGFIEDESVAALREGARESHPLAFSAGERVHRPSEQVVHRGQGGSPLHRESVGFADPVPCPDMRETAQRDVLGHGHRKRDVFSLRDDRNGSGDGATVERRNGPPIDTHVARLRNDAADERADKSALA